MNMTGFQNSTTLKVNLNTSGKNLNTSMINYPNVLPPAANNYLYYNGGTGALGAIPAFVGNGVEVAPSAIISESGGGIAINGALAISGYADVGATLNNISTLLNNLTGLTV